MKKGSQKFGRKEFIKTLGLGGASLVLPGVAKDINGIQTSLLSQSIKIYDNYIVGVTHYKLGACYEKIRVGDRINLKRMSENKYDRFAIAVEWEDFFLGYLPAYENIVLANLMDAGVKLEGMVTSKHSFHHLGVGIWAEMITSPGYGSKEKLSEIPADEVEDKYRG